VPSAAAAPNLVQVSQRQQGNPVLRHLRGVRWAFADIVPDYLCGSSTAVLFLSLRYHLLQPEYVLHRLAAVQRAYRLMVLLLLVDAEEVWARMHAPGAEGRRGRGSAGDSLGSWGDGDVHIRGVLPACWGAMSLSALPPPWHQENVVALVLHAPA
jgi:DNA repair protein Rad10